MICSKCGVEGDEQRSLKCLTCHVVICAFCQFECHRDPAEHEVHKLMDVSKEWQSDLQAKSNQSIMRHSRMQKATADMIETLTVVLAEIRETTKKYEVLDSPKGLEKKLSAGDMSYGMVELLDGELSTLDAQWAAVDSEAEDEIEMLRDILECAANRNSDENKADLSWSRGSSLSATSQATEEGVTSELILAQDYPDAAGYDVVLMVGEEKSKNGIGFQIYPNNMLKNFSIAKLEDGGRHDFAGQLLNGRVVIAGGVSNGCYIYDLKERTWSVAPNLPDCLLISSATVANEKLFILGGMTGNKFHGTCYSLDVGSNTWLRLASLNVARSGSSCTVLGNEIFVCGGFDGVNWLCSVEIYDTVQDLWKAGTPMTTARDRLSVVALNGCLYAIGGENTEVEASSTCEKYDPASGKWESIASLTTGRWYCSAVVYKRAIHVLGGQDDTGNCLRSVEVYDSERNEWKSAPDMEMELWGFGCSVLHV